MKDSLRLLKREAIRSDPHSYRGRGKWLKAKVLACSGDEQSLEDLRQLVGRLPWAYPPSVIDDFLEEEKHGQAFDAVESQTPIEKAKKRWPIKEYCEEMLGLRFKHRKCKCPLHDGDSETSFVIDEKTNHWFCFGNCPHEPGKNHRKGDVVDLHRLWNGFQGELEAVKDLLSAKPKSGQCRAKGQHSFFSLKPKSNRPTSSFSKMKLMAKVLAAASKVTRSSIREASAKPTSAFDFGDWLLRQSESIDGHFVVGRTKYEALVGLRARRAIAKAPYRLQYLCCSTAKTESPHKTEENLNVEHPLFLNVEFDRETSENQLKILWWLKTVRKWKLVCITWSGGKSWHGLFDVRQVASEELSGRRELALRLGACAKSLAPSHWVRFPGGTRTDEEWQQKPVAKQEILYFRG